jgi:arginyl-tRNA synthetase
MNIAPESTALEHVWFGLMRLPEGTFSTRQGNVIKLEALLDEAESRARKIISESRPDMPEAEAAELAAKIGIGAVKYSDLSQDPRTMITFTWDKALSLDGNSGPYLQYAHARIRSVLEKYKAQFPELDYESYPIVLNEDIERSLALKLAMYPSAVKKAAQSYRPCVLADYLYELSQLYSSFYQRVPFLKAEEGVRESRIRICSIVAKVLSQGLGILGIEAPERI